MEKQKFFDMMEDIVGQIIQSRDPDHEISQTTCMKNNDQLLTGLVLKRKESNVCPVLYMDELYTMYQGGETIPNLVQMMVNAFDHAVLQTTMMDFMTDYQMVKPCLSLRLVEIERNREWLKDKIYDVVGIYARVCYINAEKFFSGLIEGEPDPARCMITIRKEMMEPWGCSEDQVVEDALKNLTEGAKAIHFLSLEEILHEIAPNLSMKRELENQNIVVITTEDRTLGAVLITLPEVQMRVADILGSDYYVIPSSIHEVFAVRKDLISSAQDLLEIVHTVNREEVKPVEVLSDSLMYFDIEKKQLIFL